MDHCVGDWGWEPTATLIGPIAVWGAVTALAAKLVFRTSFLPMWPVAALSFGLDQWGSCVAMDYWQSHITRHIEESRRAEVEPSDVRLRLFSAAYRGTSVALTALGLAGGAAVYCSLSGVAVPLGTLLLGAFACSALRHVIQNALLVWAPNALSKAQCSGCSHGYHRRQPQPMGDLARLGLMGGVVLLATSTTGGLAAPAWTLCTLVMSMDMIYLLIGIMERLVDRMGWRGLGVDVRSSR